ncbi:unnamed protein product, partial [Adineta ricciae]
MQFPSSSPQNPISSSTNSSPSNNVLFLPSNTSKMSFIIPNNNNNTNNTNSSQQPMVSSANILSSTLNSGMATSVNLNGTNSSPSNPLNQTSQQRVSIPPRTTSHSSQIPQED